MTEFLQLLRDILWLRRGPQDVPYSPILLVACCVAALTLQLVLASIFTEGGNLVASLIALLLDLGLLYFVLMLRGFTSRFVQTATALIACTILFTLIALPITFIVGTPPKATDQVTAVQGVLGLVALVVITWKLVVDAHILRHALSIPFFAGLALAIFWVIAEYAFGAALQTQAVVSP
jgi:hypothetical protein